MEAYLKRVLAFAALAAALGFVLVVSTQVEAQTQPPSGYQLTVPFPGHTGPVNGPADYIRTIYTFGLGFGALLAMVMIVIGAVKYTLSEAVYSKEEAKAKILSAIWGLVLLLAATVILFTVNPDLPDLYEPELPAALPPQGTP